MRLNIKPSKLSGDIFLPPSKSHTLRAILFASLADGKSTIYNYLHSPDTHAMVDACRLLGAQIEQNDTKLVILGVNGKIKTPNNIIDAGNSGQVLRFIASIAALGSDYTVITGDHSVRTNRPIQPLLKGLEGLNVFGVSTKNDGYAPIIIKGPIKPGITHLSGEDSQPVSGLLIATAFAFGASEIFVKNPGETPWIDLTLDWFKKLGIKCTHENYEHYMVSGYAHYSGFEYTVPGDFSTAAFPLVAALVTQSEITLHNIDMSDIQGDKEIISVLKKMGAQLRIDDKKKTLAVSTGSKLQGLTIDINRFIDAVTILAVCACFAEGDTRITGASIARKKESNRLESIAVELNKMGGKITVTDDGLVISPSKLYGTTVMSYHDHRVAMSLAVAALAAEGETIVQNINCIEKSYPDFATSMQKLSASMSIDHTKLVQM